MTLIKKIFAGLIGGIFGGVVFWIYQAAVLVGLQHRLALESIPHYDADMLISKPVQGALNVPIIYLGSEVHFGIAIFWALVFAFIWPTFRRRGYEATYIALFYAAIVWVITAIVIGFVTTADHPNYLDPVEVIAGIFAQLFYAVPMALIVRRFVTEPKGKAQPAIETKKAA